MKSNYLREFRLQRRGVWIHDKIGLCVAINEDTGRTFYAFTTSRPTWTCVVRCSCGCGKPSRFRTAESAARYLMNLFARVEILERTEDGFTAIFGRKD